MKFCYWTVFAVDDEESTFAEAYSTVRKFECGLSAVYNYLNFKKIWQCHLVHIAAECK